MSHELELFDLGELYVSDFLADGEEPRHPPARLRLVMDADSREARLDSVVDPDFMYGRYWYRSGTNATMTRELGDVVQSITRAVTLAPGDVWLDIASNDGTLLRQVSNACHKIGIDPADNTFAEEARATGAVVVQDYFSAAAYRHAAPLGSLAKVVTCIAMFYDLDDPDPFLTDVRDVLRADGVFVIQMSYTPLMLEQTAFDNICHEHVYYYTLLTLEARLKKAGLQVVDVQLNDVNGGSFRVYAVRDDADPGAFGSQPYRDVCRARVESIRAYEEAGRWNDPERWFEFRDRVSQLRRDTRDFIKTVKKMGKTVWGYGASTKGNTLLQLFGLDHTMLDGIAERSPYKYGLRTVGTDVPITDEATMRAADPDYLLMLPWHFVKEFTEREGAYLDAGGAFIVPCPEFGIVQR